MKQQGRFWDQLASHPLDASVIDPKDPIGSKNRYLAEIRNREILRALHEPSGKPIVLDLGCGTGSLSSALVAGGWEVIGIDISRGLLSRTPERGLGEHALFTLYDGKSFPIRDSSVDAIVTYVVLNHIIEDDDLATVLSECCRVLKPGCQMVCIEQIRRKPHLDTAGWKRQRTLDDFMSIYSRAQLRVRSRTIIRFGHFPTTGLIRFGVIPARLFHWIALAERTYGRLRGIARRDYCDVIFELDKSKDDA